MRDATIAAIPVSVADTAPTASTCAFCREAHPVHDFTTCDQCDAPVCVHCCNTRDSEDVVCPECFKQHWRGVLTARLASATRTVCEDCGCEEYCIDYLRDSLAALADPAPDLTPEPWGMSIAALDSWGKYYRDRLRAGLSLSAAESAHRAEVARNIALRHEERRYTIARHEPAARKRTCLNCGKPFTADDPKESLCDDCFMSSFV